MGRAFALGLAADGAEVAVLGRTEQALNETVSAIESVGGAAFAVCADVADPSSMDAAAEAIHERLGALDVLLNNAAVMGYTGPDWEVSPERWWSALEVNLLGAYRCVHLFLPRMMKRGTGRIINVSSGAASMRVEAYTSYSTSKAALTHWTDCLGTALRKHGIAVFALGPGFQRTPGTEAMLDDPAVHASVRTIFQELFEQRREVGEERAVELLCRLARGEADELTGRYVSVHDDMAKLTRDIAEILREDKLTLRIRT